MPMPPMVANEGVLAAWESGGVTLFASKVLLWLLLEGRDGNRPPPITVVLEAAATVVEMPFTTLRLRCLPSGDAPVGAVGTVVRAVGSFVCPDPIALPLT